MISCCYPDCRNEATHILVDYLHEVFLPLEIFCEEHAFEETYVLDEKPREECSCCGDREFFVEYDEGEIVRLFLTPAYPSGTLDKYGCCSDHP